MKELLFHCELNINAISELAKGKQLSCLSLARIADYLDCSVDYLLGHTDEQTATYYTHNIKDGNVVQSNNSVAVNGSVFNSGSISTSVSTDKNKDLSNEETEILNIYRSLNIRNKTKFLNLILGMENEENS